MMVIDAESDADQVITIAGKAIGRVERFKFLGSIVTNDSNSSTEINVRLAIARQVMRQLTEIWKSAEISLKLKKQLVTSLVWSIALYGSESWAVKKCDENGLRRLNCGAGDVCCVSAGLNTRPMFGCGRRLACRSRMGYLNS